jgi:hypothetical protein
LNRAQQNAQSLRVGDGAATVGGGYVLLEQLEQAHAREEVVDQGKRTQPLGEDAQRGG